MCEAARSHREIVRAYCTFERTKFSTRCQTHLRERRARALVGPQSFGVLSTAVEREYEQRPPALPERLLRDHAVKQRESLAVPTASQFRLGQLLDDAPPLLLQVVGGRTPRL